MRDPDHETVSFMDILGNDNTHSRMAEIYGRQNSSASSGYGRKD